MILIKINLSLFLLLSLTPSVLGQTSAPTSLDVPEDSNVLLLVLAPKECPLVIKNAEYVEKDRGNWWGASYEVKNGGSKSIRSFTTLILTSFGTGGTLGHFNPEKPFLPGNTLLAGDGFAGQPIRLAPVHERAGVKSDLRAIVVLMIGKIVFSDGSVYDNEQSFKKLQAYFEARDITRRQ